MEEREKTAWGFCGVLAVATLLLGVFWWRAPREADVVPRVEFEALKVSKTRELAEQSTTLGAQIADANDAASKTRERVVEAEKKFNDAIKQRDLLAAQSQAAEVAAQKADKDLESLRESGRQYVARTQAALVAKDSALQSEADKSEKLASLARTAIADADAGWAQAEKFKGEKDTMTAAAIEILKACKTPTEAFEAGQKDGFAKALDAFGPDMRQRGALNARGNPRNQLVHAYWRGEGDPLP